MKTVADGKAQPARCAQSVKCHTSFAARPKHAMSVITQIIFGHSTVGDQVAILV